MIRGWNSRILLRKQRKVQAGLCSSRTNIFAVTVKVTALRVTNTCAVRLLQATVMHVSTWTALSARIYNRHGHPHGRQMLQDVEISYRITRDTITTHAGRHIRVRKETAQWEPTAGGNFNLGPPTPHILGSQHITIPSTVYEQSGWEFSPTRDKQNTVLFQYACRISLIRDPSSCKPKVVPGAPCRLSSVP